MVDMALTEADRRETAGMPTALMDHPGPQYPYGLCISLCEKELDKLRLDINEAAIGDTLDMRCIGVITALSQTDGPDGPCCRVEIQLQRIATAE